MPEDYEKAFLRANAKAPFIGRTLADIVRRVMRASINNDGSQRHEAAEAIRLFLDLAAASREDGLYEVIDQAVADLAVEREWDSYEADNLRIAEAATRYLLEMSCKDGFARGRASKRWNDVETGFRVREEMRAWRGRKWGEEYAAGKSEPKGKYAK